jgi:filamentous hemagglutinin family protein
MKGRRARIHFAPKVVAVAVASCFATGNAGANPTGPQVVNGTVSFARPNASTLNVTNSPGAIINWQGFSIGASEVTRFIQQSAASAVLNRVVGGNISQIQGQLLSNGRVFLINPSGIVVGPGAVIDTAGFVGSTLNMLDADFLAGKLKFQGDGTSGSIINQGWIRTTSDGQVILVAPQVENSGLIHTPNGQIILAAGKSLTIASLDHEGVQFEIQAPTDAVVNVGKLLAEGGAIGVFAGTLKHSGDIRATSLSADATGRIVLKASGNVELAAGSISDASGPAGGNVSVKADVLFQTGEVRADGASGGNVTMQARNLQSAGRISADSTQGAGGAIDLRASNSIIQTSAARISADGATGDGGSVNMQAGSRLFSSTTTSATSGSGKGGTVNALGSEIVLLGAALDVSGGAGGGTVLVGGDFKGNNTAVPNARNTAVNFATTLKADAKGAGDGGRIIVWSNERTDYFGQASARGGMQSGNGGLIEVSGREKLIFGGSADAGAPYGRLGTLLLDPKNITIDAAGSGAAYSTIDLVDPNPGAGDGFAQTVTVLSGGNIVARDSSDDFGATNAGAVYLYNGTTGALISALNGTSTGDQVGSGGITTLSNGNYLVRSPNWNNVSVTAAGAVTWGSGTSGVSGVVSAANSLVGSTASDQVGSGGITQLASGNYLVLSPNWDIGVATQAGAVTWGSGTSGVSGTVSSVNSLVGSTTNDNVGSGGITALSNGNYLVRSPNWNNVSVTAAGAALSRR